MANDLKGSVVPSHLRDGRYRHMAEVLDEEPPWLLKKLTVLLSGHVGIDDYTVARLKELAGHGPIIYAMKYRSIFDLHFLRIRLSELGLPVPSFAFGVSPEACGSISKAIAVRRASLAWWLQERRPPDPVDPEVLKDVLGQGSAAVFFLVDEKTSRSRYVHPDHDPIGTLLELQGKLAGVVTVVPMFILYDRTSRRVIRPFWETFLGDPDQPGPVRRILGALRKWTVPELLIGEPVHLMTEFEEFGSEKTWEELPFDVRQELIASINARIRVNRGPERLSRTEIKERVLQDARVQRAVREEASKDDVPEEKVRKKAEAYVDEMAADQRTQIHHLLYYVLKWMFAKVFDGVDLRQSQFALLKEANQSGSLIYVSCHKSHFDYLIVGYLAFINQMAVPYMAAGKNLSFWPVGPLLRNGGGFFIRRTFKGLALYTYVFSAYLKVLIREKANINFYIEGGRSRTGKLLPPRVGMLMFLIQALEEGDSMDMSFVPSFIGYDQIPEEGSYLRELAGREKRKESLLAFIRSRKVLQKRFGKVYVRFADPISYKEFTHRWNGGTEVSKLSMKENRKILMDFAYHLMSAIVRIGVVSPIDLTAASLICWGGRQVSHGTLLHGLEIISAALRRQGIEFAESLENPQSAVERAMGVFRRRGFVSVPEDSVAGQTEYVINLAKRAHLDFYRNGLVNYVWPYSVLAAILLRADRGSDTSAEALREEFSFLMHLMSKELITDPLVSPEALLQDALDFFREQGWITADGSLEREPLVCFRGIIADLLELYYLVLVAAADVDENGTNQKDLTKRMLVKAEEYRSGSNASPVPAPASVTVGNALLRFSEMGILEYRQSKKFLKGVGDRTQWETVRDRLAGALPLNVIGPCGGA